MKLKDSNKKMPYQKAEMEIIDLSGAENFFAASGENPGQNTGGSNDGWDNDG